MTPALVLVQHGASKAAALDRLLSPLALPVERVRNDLPGHALADPNEALEFSGYQEGLARVLTALAPGNAMATVMFANDTLADGHPRALAELLLTQLPALPAPARPRLVGLVMPASPPIALVTGPAGYVSTWAFALQAPRELLERVRFYESDEVLARFHRTRLPTLPAAYRAWLDGWLAPTHWLRGWYKARPGVPLPEATRRRKELAIYLEHRLPGRLAALGFETVDLGALLPAPLKLWRGLLRHADRINVNRLKLQHRLGGARGAGA